MIGGYYNNMSDNTSSEVGQKAQVPSSIPLSGWLDVARRVKDQFSEDHVTLSAAGVAFFSFGALVPLLVATVSIYGLVADPADIADLASNIEGAVPVEVANLIEQQLSSITTTSSQTLGLATIFSIAVSLWSASSAFGHLIEALNIAYDEDTDQRPFWKRRGR